MGDIIYTCLGAVITIPGEDGSGKSIKAFAGCGQVLNELVEQVPFDGERHEYACPKCGTMHVVKRTTKAHEGPTDAAASL